MKRVFTSILTLCIILLNCGSQEAIFTKIEQKDWRLVDVEKGTTTLCKNTQKGQHHLHIYNYTTNGVTATKTERPIAIVDAVWYASSQSAWGQLSLQKNGYKVSCIPSRSCGSDHSESFRRPDVNNEMWKLQQKQNDSINFAEARECKHYFPDSMNSIQTIELENDTLRILSTGGILFRFNYTGRRLLNNGEVVEFLL